jgi:acyl-coenzyme A thioesterase 13
MQPTDFNELDHVKTVWANMQGNSPIYDFLLSDIELVSAIKGRVTARLTLGPRHVNSRKGIHGAVSATIVDFMGGLSIATHGMMKTGASVDIHVTYLSTATVGDEVEIVGVANKVGKSMAFTSVTITKLVDGTPGPIVASASHTKYIRQAS